MKKRIANATPSLIQVADHTLLVSRCLFGKGLPFIGVLNGVDDLENKR
jgi:hypothetical protein